MATFADYGAGAGGGGGAGGWTYGGAGGGAYVPYYPTTAGSSTTYTHMVHQIVVIEGVVKIVLAIGQDIYTEEYTLTGNEGEDRAKIETMFLKMAAIAFEKAVKKEEET